MVILRKILYSTAIYWALQSFCLAGPLQDLTQIEKDARQFVQQHLRETNPYERVEVAPFNIDPNLRLDACDKALTFNLHGHQQSASNVTVKVACKRQWSFYLNSAVDRWRQVLVATRNLPRGVKLSSDDVAMREIKTGANSNGLISSLEDTIGMETQRSIVAGSPIRASYLEQPEVVQRGDQLVVLARGAGIAVSTTAIALSGGKQGQQIRVKNLKTKKIFQARVVSTGRAEVRL